MKRFLLMAGLSLAAVPGLAQITIDDTDMPVLGDTLRYSIVNPAGAGINLSGTGANTSWNFSGLVPFNQGVDEYKSPGQVNAAYASVIPAGAYGFKLADTFDTGSGSMPVTVTEVYNFFEKKTAPDRFAAVAFAAKISGLPTPINYSNEDEWYFFPLEYGDVDTSSYRLTYNMFGIGSLMMKGTRETTVDGWGTITTPYFTTPVQCLRVRSEINEIDSVTFAGTNMAIPRHTVEYRWLVKGEHYPALWVYADVVGGNEVISNIRMRDIRRTGLLSVANTNAAVRTLAAYPNPAADGRVTLEIPADWQAYTVEVFDLQGKVVASFSSQAALPLQSLAAGQYLIRVRHGREVGFVRITR